jgi:hypothetical protein
MKTLIFSDDVLTWGKTKKETEDKLNQWNITIEEYRLKTNTDKIVSMTISKIPDTDIRLKLDGKIVTGDTFIYLENSINLEWNIHGVLNR